MSLLPPLPAASGLFIPDDDFCACVDLRENLILERYDTLATIALSHTLRRTQLHPNEVETPLATAEVRFHLEAAELPDAPRVDDRLLDSDGVVWTITAVRAATNRSRYVCWCERA